MKRIEATLYCCPHGRSISVRLVHTEGDRSHCNGSTWKHFCGRLGPCIDKLDFERTSLLRFRMFKNELEEGQI